MKKLALAFALTFITVSAFAQKCEISINSESWAVKLTESQEKKISKILKKKGFSVIEKNNANSFELKLDINYKRGLFRGEIADSKSSAKILKGKDVIASTEKSYCAVTNESYVDRDYGIGDIVLFGATEEGAHRRLIKSIKELPDCDQLLI